MNTEQTAIKQLMPGLFELKDTHGLPLDISFLLCKEHNRAPDIAEILCKAWLHNCLSFEKIERELIDLGYIQAIITWKQLGSWFLKNHPKAKLRTNPIDIYCKWLLAKKIR